MPASGRMAQAPEAGAKDSNTESFTNAPNTVAPLLSTTHAVVLSLTHQRKGQPGHSTSAYVLACYPLCAKRSALSGTLDLECFPAHSAAHRAARLREQAGRALGQQQEVREHGVRGLILVPRHQRLQRLLYALQHLRPTAASSSDTAKCTLLLVF